MEHLRAGESHAGRRGNPRALVITVCYDPPPDAATPPMSELQLEDRPDENATPPTPADQQPARAELRPRRGRPKRLPPELPTPDWRRVDPADLSNPALYINRELSWLAFNQRVLAQAQDPYHPLLERVKFLGIAADQPRRVLHGARSRRC